MLIRLNVRYDVQLLLLLFSCVYYSILLLLLSMKWGKGKKKKLSNEDAIPPYDLNKKYGRRTRGTVTWLDGARRAKHEYRR